MRWLLKIKHWQLFILLVGIPIILQFVVAGMFINIGFSPYVYSIIPISIILVMMLYFSWLYAIGTGLQSMLPASVKMNSLPFKFLLLIPALYIICISIGIFMLFNSAAKWFPPNPLIFLLIIPIHLFFMCCMFFCFHFNAKSLKSVELQRPVKFDDFAGEFFLLWFFPVGIWIIQPKINKLFNDNI
jgi:hypothetical protein